MSETGRAVHELVTYHLNKIAKHIPRSRYKFTFVARCFDPMFEGKNADITVGDDLDLDKVIACLKRLEREGKEVR
jgi:hypothetical protein